MEKKIIKIIVPKRGWQIELAREVGCTVQTVINALHHGAKGKKSNLVRHIYIAKYGNKRLTNN